MSRAPLALGLVGLALVVAVGALITLGDRENPEPAALGPQDAAESQTQNEPSTTAATTGSGDAVLPDGWASVAIADCAEFAPPAAIEQAASLNPHGWTAQQLCAWMLANSDVVRTDMASQRQRRTAGWDAQFPQGAFNSPYRQFSDADLEMAALNDGVASFVLATRLQHVDRERADELFIQSAKQTKLPGPLMAAVFGRDGVELVRDPASGTVAYADPEDVFKTAVLAMTVRHMGYDFQKVDFFMEHVVMAMGPGATDAVLTESQSLYQQITTGGP